MKLTETALRKIIREELIKEMHEKEDAFKMTGGDIAVGIGGGALFATPLAIATFLQSHPEMMAKVQAFLQSLMEE